MFGGGADSGAPPPGGLFGATPPLDRARASCLAKLEASAAWLDAAGRPGDVAAAAGAVQACAEALKALRDL